MRDRAIVESFTVDLQGHIGAKQNGRQAMFSLKRLVPAGILLISVGVLADQYADPYADPYAEPALPQTEMIVTSGNTALVITDPQIDFLSEDGVTWGVVGASVTENNTVENIGDLLAAAKEAGMMVVISPHYYYPSDHGWKFGGPLEKLMHAIGMFDRRGPLSLDNFVGSGADFMPEYKAMIMDGETVITSPHKVYGPESNDLSLQLRKAGIDKVILAGMSANLCVQAHMHELLEQGYEVAIVRDATAGARLPEGDGYLAALINFRYMANDLWTTEEAVELIASTKLVTATE